MSSCDALTVDPISARPPGPVGTLGTSRAVRAVHPSLVRAADALVGRDDGVNAVLLHESQNSNADRFIMANVTSVGNPLLHRDDVTLVLADDPHGRLARPQRIRPVPRQRRERVSRESVIRLAAEPIARSPIRAVLAPGDIVRAIA